MNNKNKYFGILLVGIVIILLIVASVAGSNKKETNTEKEQENVEVILANAQEESKKITAEEQKQLPEINMDTYLEYYNGEEAKLVLLARPTCGYCQVAEPIIKKIAKDYNIDIAYLNTDNFQENDQEKLMHSDEFFKEGFGTPVLLCVGQGKIIDKVDGLTDTNHYISFFQRNNFIK